MLESPLRGTTAGGTAHERLGRDEAAKQEGTAFLTQLAAAGEANRRRMAADDRSVLTTRGEEGQQPRFRGTLLTFTCRMRATR